MKKVLTLTLLAVTLLGACEKVENQTATQEQTLNRVVALSGNAKTGNSTHLFAMSMGHSSKDCKGCVMMDGHRIHINCMGAGDECAYTFAVQLQQIGTAVTATTTDTFDLTSEDFGGLLPRAGSLAELHGREGQPHLPEHPRADDLS